ncbi:hypothetical protein [Streptomyces sp. NPDC020747]|uniref:hypothetical protein n=1 Tax=Streptomyces sp. NPDC020747 TaxID=3365086 RepID=UPI0037B0D061
MSAADELRDPDDSDHTPTRFDCRQHEMRDLRDQGPGPHALWTAVTVPTGRYL